MTTALRRFIPGFTLIEVMAVVLLTALVLGVSLDYYNDLSNASQRAMDRTREVRRATAILDRIVRDLQGATLVTKADGEDRLSHPWIFLAENRGYSARGSDRIKFVTRDYEPKRQSENLHEPDLAFVTYRLEEDEGGMLALRRGISPGLADPADLHNFPGTDETQLLTNELESLTFTFLDEQGSWQEEWDSNEFLQADQLPVAVKIELELRESLVAADERDDSALEAFDEEKRALPSRTVVLHARPIDVALLLDPLGPWGTGNKTTGSSLDGSEDGDDEFLQRCPSGNTVKKCLDVTAALAGSWGQTNLAGYVGNPQVQLACISFFVESNQIPLEFVRPECQ